MNVRRMVMVMLVLGVMVGGASAAVYSYGAYAPAPTPPTYTTTSDDVTFTIPAGSYYIYGSSNSDNWHSGGYMTDVGLSFPYLFQPDSALWGCPGDGWCDYTIPYSGYLYNMGSFGTSKRVVGGGQYGIAVDSSIHDGGVKPQYVSVAFVSTDTVEYSAAGTACTNGTFTYYIESNYSGSSNNSYSFPIFDGADYQIYFSGTGTWHNFTAIGADTWNPGCASYSLSGTITALDGEGVYNLQVFLHEWYLYERDLVATTYTDSNGTYSFSDVYEGVYSLAASGYCNSGVDCAVFNIDAPITVGGVNSTYDFTWHIPSNIRIDLQYENGTAVSNALLNMKNLPSATGAWKTTASDGYTTYTSLQTSKVYVDYHGGDNSSGGPAGSDVLHSFQLVPNGQYRWSQFVLSIPDDYANNTTIPPLLPPVDEVNKTDISNMTTDSMFLVSVNDVLGSPIPQVTVTASAADKNYTGKFSGFTNTSGQWSFPKNSTVGQYDVSVGITCFLPQTKTRYSSADFTLEYSCDAELPGQDENGTGGWKSNESYSNWTMNGTAADESTTKTKLSSWLYFFGVGIFFIMFATYFVKK